MAAFVSASLNEGKSPLVRSRSWRPEPGLALNRRSLPPVVIHPRLMARFLPGLQVPVLLDAKISRILEARPLSIEIFTSPLPWPSALAVRVDIDGTGLSGKVCIISQSVPYSGGKRLLGESGSPCRTCDLGTQGNCVGLRTIVDGDSCCFCHLCVCDGRELSLVDSDYRRNGSIGQSVVLNDNADNGKKRGSDEHGTARLKLEVFAFKDTCNGILTVAMFGRAAAALLYGIVYLGLDI